jgi:hypothetical protein
MTKLVYLVASLMASDAGAERQNYSCNEIKKKNNHENAKDGKHELDFLVWLLHRFYRRLLPTTT